MGIGTEGAAGEQLIPQLLEWESSLLFLLPQLLRPLRINIQDIKLRCKL